jgi:acetylglutamate kinase
MEKILVFKYGGNAMIDDELKTAVVRALVTLKNHGYHLVVVHGGGPFIRDALAEAKIESEFIDGQRKTTVEALQHVEKTLKGKVNADLVSLFNREGHRSVGLSGKDGKIVTARKRVHHTQVNGNLVRVDLGQVGDVEEVDPGLLILLLENNYIPVITCVASDAEGNDYNINGDLFGGHIAGALKAEQFIVLTDVDGLMLDKHRPDTIIPKLQIMEVEDLKQRGIIQGGMIPKIDACEIALENGAQSARIINGTQPEQISGLFANSEIGTLIKA